MRLLFVTDRLSLRGGADQHLLQVIGSAATAGHTVTVACGRQDHDVALPETVTRAHIRGLAARLASCARLGNLDRLLAQAEVVHVQNVMNPVVLRHAVATGRAVVTVQDHRVFCPAMGKTLPDGSRCSTPMSTTACTPCLPEPAYRQRALGVTRARRDAVAGARLIVLSAYMATELAAAGLPGATVLPAWVEVGARRPRAGRGLVLGGRLVLHKGVTHAHRAWRRAATGHPLIVAGAGPLEGELDGADRRGWMPHPELISLLHGARALLFPGWWQEPFGILGVEALAQSTPVVVAAGGGTTEWSGAGCLRCAPGDIDEMADAIRRLAADPELARSLGEAGRTMVSHRFSRATVEPRLREIYSEVAG